MQELHGTKKGETQTMNESNLITAVQMPDSSMGLRCVDINVPPLQKVACYIRVSTESPDQEDSYEAQEKYFTKLLVSHPDWKSVGIYSDYGISGTRQETRTGLKRLIRHCEEGKINRIICKSISRFSRNTADTLKIIRKLWNIGVTIFFEKEGLDTSDMKSEFILTTLAALAQEESRTISENIRWGHSKRAPKGDVPNEAIFGYKWGDYERTSTGYRRKSVEIIEEKAEIVRRIFTLFVDGYAHSEIARILNAENAPARNEKTGWTRHQIAAVLKNERYCGDVLTFKNFTPDFISHKKQKNLGEVPQYYIRDHHPAIISRELFQQAQKRIHTMPVCGIKTIYPFSKCLKCPYCGANYQKTGNGWECASVKLRNGKDLCKAEKVSDETLKAMFRKAVLARFQSSSRLLAALETSQNLDFVERDRSIMKKQIAIVENNLSEVMSTYDTLKAELEFRNMRDELNGLDPECAEQKASLSDLQNRIRTLTAEKEHLEAKLTAKEKQWDLMESGYEMRRELIVFMMHSTGAEILENLHHYVKALAASVIVHSPTEFTVFWFDGTETQITM